MEAYPGDSSNLGDIRSRGALEEQFEMRSRPAKLRYYTRHPGSLSSRLWKSLVLCLLIVSASATIFDFEFVISVVLV